MHDHDSRRSQFLIRTSPPRVCELAPSTQNHLKQTQNQDFQQDPYHQMQHHQYQQQFLHQHHLNQYSHQQHENVPHEGHPPYRIFPTTTALPIARGDPCNVEDFEDVDEDQISDFDEEEELRLSYENYRQRFHKQPDVTSQLLQFADMVSADIKKFFGRTKDQDDSCDVYEDKWTTAKSGRELYYADLLRIAQGDTETHSKTTKASVSSLSSPSSSSLSPMQDLDNRSNFSGKRDDSVGIGPLSELFEYKFPSFLQNDKEHRGFGSSKARCASQKNYRSQKIASRVIPMQERNFPESFWREPCSRGNGLMSGYSNSLQISQHNMLSSSKLPDFSDLVESWQGVTESMTVVEGQHKDSTDISVDHHRL